jgi:hypothetical protein
LCHETDAAVTVPVTVAAEATTETTEQEDDEENDKYEAKRHDLISGSSTYEPRRGLTAVAHRL